VTALRRHLLVHSRLAALLIAVALLMRIVIPTGYMLVEAPGGGITFAMCSGYGPVEPVVTEHAMHHGGADAHGASKSGHDKHDEAAKEMPCAFAGAATAALAATDPLLLAVALFFILAATFRLPVRLPVAATPFLRPPLRGPPVTA
jgi:hypothetical protein